MKLAVSPIHPGRAITACDLCGTRFLSWIYKEQRYCSRRCAGLARRVSVHCTCSHCGVDFLSIPAKKATYCGRACKDAAARGRVSPRRIDLAGERFARLLVIGPADNHSSGRTQWLCACDCGNTTTVMTQGLRSGKTRSCGCLLAEHTARLGRNHHDARHVTHGGSRTPEYSIWHDMKRRCENPANKGYPHYGGRGITVSTQWQDFTTFYQDMGPRPGPTFTIERKDVNQSYSKDNCIWIERRYQQRNTTRNRLLTFDGRTQTMFEWAREIGISPAGLCTRLNREGLPLEEALTRPVRGRKRAD